MGDGYHFLDIILLAMIAGFIALRLRSVLGRRTGHEAPPRPLPLDGASDRRAPESLKPGALPPPAAPPSRPLDPVQAGIADIRSLDPGFEPEEFTAGAKAAYEMIVLAYAKGDKEVLRPLLGANAFASFAQGIDERRAAGRVQETTLDALRRAEITSAALKGQEAEITVRFVADLINATRDAEGRIVAGNPNAAEEVSDLWTFSRDLRSQDPNWMLIATRPAA